MKTVEIYAAEIGDDRWAVLSKTANLDEFDMSQFKAWKIGYKPQRYPTILETLNLMEAKQGTPAFQIEYPVRFAQAHITSVSGPSPEYSSDSPDADFIANLPPAIVDAFTARCDTTQGISREEYDALKKPVALDGNDSSSEKSETQSN